MKIHLLISQHRNDFVADMVCEHCGHTFRLNTGYDDTHYHEKVIPGMHCDECGRNRAGELKPMAEEEVAMATQPAALAEQAPLTEQALGRSIRQTDEPAPIVSDPDFKEKHWRSSKVLMGPVENNHDETGQIVEPWRLCRIVTENGQFWGIAMNAFIATEELVKELWDKKPSAFQRINMEVSE